MELVEAMKEPVEVLVESVEAMIEPLEVLWNSWMQKPLHIRRYRRLAVRPNMSIFTSLPLSANIDSGVSRIELTSTTQPLGINAAS